MATTKRVAVSNDDMYVVKLSRKKITKLRAATQYAFAMLAHIAQEQYVLQKLYLVSRPPAGIDDHYASAATTQLVMLLRIIAGKVHEGGRAIRGMSAFPQFLWAQPEYQTTWDLLNEDLKKSKWLRRIRNAQAFHYGAFDTDFRDIVKQWPGDPQFVIGRARGNDHFELVETVMLFSMLGLKATEGDKFAARFDDAVTEINDLSVRLSELLHDVLSAFTWNRLGGSEVEATPLPTYETMTGWLSFFHAEPYK